MGAILTGAKIFGRLLIAAITYFVVSTVIFFSSFLLLKNGVPVDLPWILAVERNLYFEGAWHIWQSQPECVEFDSKLIYKPKVGSCRFTNAEFDTVLNFSKNGRQMGDVNSIGKAIAVVGDSFAMGWGVGDAETYAAELQRRTGRKVYNLAVSSYGTVRELMRLEGSGLLDSVDTVIIHYCDNDLDENMNFSVPSEAESRKIFLKITEPSQADRLSLWKYLYREYKFTVKYPIEELRATFFHKEELEDFVPHYGPLIKAIAKVGALKEKRIVVIYSKSYGAKFRNFPVGKDREMSNVLFVDLDVNPKDFYLLDPHLNKRGHEKIGRELADVIKRLP
jgi:hypothetical protein